MDFHLPELGEGVYEGEMTRWLVRAGEKVKPGQVLLEVLTDKATMEVPAPFAGTVESLKVQEGKQIKVGDIILAYKADDGKEAPQAAPAVASAAPAAGKKAAKGNGAGTAVKAAPSVRVLARQLGVDLTGVQGSGPDGRILLQDLTRVVQPSGAEHPVYQAEGDFGRPGTRIKLLRLRRAIAEHMVASKKTIPHFTYVDEVDVSDLVKARNGLREAMSAHPTSVAEKGPVAQGGLKITYLPFFIKAVVHALKAVPLANSSLDEESGEIVLHDHYHIGVAVAAAHGLIVPVVRDADKLGLLELAREVDRLTVVVRAGKAKREDLMGGTFTITSFGNFGGLFATPIIHHPQVGIVGIGKIVKRPVFDSQGQVRGADMLYLSFSFDHRVLDGASATAFGNALIGQLQNPFAMVALP
jgi:pyruvate/2-oxoglutarate dehydrogenase complex dihydrolipoamide acyltransferase (E2) component